MFWVQISSRVFTLGKDIRNLDVYKATRLMKISPSSTMSSQFTGVLVSRKLGVSYSTYAFLRKFPASLGGKRVTGCSQPIFYSLQEVWRCAIICTQLLTHHSWGYKDKLQDGKKNSLRKGNSLTLPKDMRSAENFPKNISYLKYLEG